MVKDIVVKKPVIIISRVKVEQVLDDGLAPPDRIIGITAEISTPVYTANTCWQCRL